MHMPGNYTRTLVGPLTANAAKLYDDQKQFGIFFTFQDLSVRTEGTLGYHSSRQTTDWPHIYRHVPSTLASY